MNFAKVALCLTIGLCLSAGAVFAGPDSPTFSPGEVQCHGGDCSAIVMNEDGYGVIVEGKNKRKTRKAAEAAAAELNAGDDGFADPCFQNPETCLQ